MQKQAEEEEKKEKKEEDRLLKMIIYLSVRIYGLFIIYSLALSLGETKRVESKSKFRIHHIQAT